MHIAVCVHARKHLCIEEWIYTQGKLILFKYNMSESERGTPANVRTTQINQDSPRQSGTYGEPTHKVFISSIWSTDGKLEDHWLGCIKDFLWEPVTGCRSGEVSTLTRTHPSVCVSTRWALPAVSELGPFSLAHIFAWLSPTSPSGLALV